MGKKYPIENEARKLLAKFGKLIDELILGVRKLVKFCTTIPKNKMDKMYWMIEVIAWLLLAIAIFGRARW